MPNPLTIAPHPSAAVTASGTGTAVDLVDRSYVRLVSNVSAIDVTTAITVIVEHSLTNTNWTTVATFTPQADLSGLALIVPDCQRWLRVRWTLTGTGCTFAVTGTAYQLYATPADLVTYGMPATALARFSLAEQAAACLASSDEAAAYLASAYTLPISAWGTDLRKAVSCMAVYDLLSAGGYDPLSGKDSLIETRRNNAVAWLMRVANGQLRPPDIADTSIAIRETEAQVMSWQPRGWRGWGC